MIRSFQPRVTARLSRVVGVAMLLATCRSASATPLVENLLSVPAPQIEQGLGFNTNPANPWELDAAKAAGATEVRFQPAWSNIGTKSGELALSAVAEAALDKCCSLGLQPLLIAAYGPPFHSLIVVHAADDVPIGSYDLTVKEPIDDVNPPYCHILKPDNGQITGKWAYAGTLIDRVDAASKTVTLASATTVALPAGTALRINQLQYPSCATNSGTDPSVVAYAAYAAYLASRIAAHTANRPNGLTGRVEIWNEPPWPHDSWDGRMRYYDAGRVPVGITGASPNVGFVAALKDTTLPPNVRYNWGGTHKSGGWSLLSAHIPVPLTKAEVENSLSTESFHPYSASPEDTLWDPVRLAAATGYGSAMCTSLMGGNPGGNFKYARWLALHNQATLGWTVGQNVTETGWYAANPAAQARFVTRQFLGLHACGIDRVNFYCLYDPSGSLSFVTYDKAAQKMTPLPAYTALRSLMLSVAKIDVAPLPFAPASLPAVPVYSGPYPLVTTSVVGRKSASDKSNSILFAAWQSSYALKPAKDLTAVPSDGAVKLTWSTAFGALKYNVERAAASGGPYTPVATVNAAWESNRTAATNTYTDSGLVTGAMYYYAVTAQDDAETSGASNEVSVAASVSGAVNTASKPAAAALTFDTLPSPPPVPVTVRIPPGYNATAAWNLTAGTPVPFKVSGDKLTYNVADDVVLLDVEPR